jgi:hypothetical protein
LIGRVQSRRLACQLRRRVAYELAGRCCSAWHRLAARPLRLV